MEIFNAIISRTHACAGLLVSKKVILTLISFCIVKVSHFYSNIKPRAGFVTIDALHKSVSSI